MLDSWMSRPQRSSDQWLCVCFSKCGPQPAVSWMNTTTLDSSPYQPLQTISAHHVWRIPCLRHYKDISIYVQDQKVILCIIRTENHQCHSNIKISGARLHLVPIRNAAPTAQVIFPGPLVVSCQDMQVPHLKSSAFLASAVEQLAPGPPFPPSWKQLFQQQTGNNILLPRDHSSQEAPEYLPTKILLQGSQQIEVVDASTLQVHEIVEADRTSAYFLEELSHVPVWGQVHMGGNFH